MEILQFIFSSFWHFAGTCVILSGAANFIFAMWKRFLRHLDIKKNGWPPDHCDADGDFIIEEQDSYEITRSGVIKNED